MSAEEPPTEEAQAADEGTKEPEVEVPEQLNLLHFLGKEELCDCTVKLPPAPAAAEAEGAEGAEAEAIDASAASAPGGADSSARTRGVVVTAVTAVLVSGLSIACGLPLRFALISFGLQWAFFLLHGWPFRSEKLFDASGSLTHFLLVVTALISEPIMSPRQIVNGVLAVVWCTRLGTFLFNRIASDGKDNRFTAMKQDFWKFSVAWNFQVLWCFLLQLPILIVNNAEMQPALGLADLAGWSIWALGFLVESTADAQKFAFRSNPANRGRFITTGLWRYSRHPNYFGEICMWVGICISCSPVLGGFRLLGWLSPIFNGLILLFVSGVPMLEKAGEEKWGDDPAYRKYVEETSCVVPWVPGKFPAYLPGGLTAWLPGDEK